MDISDKDKLKDKFDNQENDRIRQVLEVLVKDGEIAIEKVMEIGGFGRESAKKFMARFKKYCKCAACDGDDECDIDPDSSACDGDGDGVGIICVKSVYKPATATDLAKLKAILAKLNSLNTVKVIQLGLTDNSYSLFISFLKKLAKTKIFSPICQKLEIEALKATNVSSLVVDKIAYHFSEWEDPNVNAIKDILGALEKDKDIEFEYRIYPNAPYTEHVKPLRLLNYNGKWHILAYKGDKIKNFRLSRMSDIKQLDPKAKGNTSDSEIKIKIKIDDYINGGFGILQGGNIKNVTIRFYEGYSESMQIEKWHDKQKEIGRGTTSSGIDYLDISLPVSQDSEIIGRVLRLGGYAEILEPADIRKKWLDTIDLMYNKFPKP